MLAQWSTGSKKLPSSREKSARAATARSKTSATRSVLVAVIAPSLLMRSGWNRAGYRRVPVFLDECLSSSLNLCCVEYIMQRDRHTVYIRAARTRTTAARPLLASSPADQSAGAADADRAALQRASLDLVSRRARWPRLLATGVRRSCQDTPLLRAHVELCLASHARQGLRRFC